MTANLILKKKYASDTYGSLAIQMFENGKKRVISLGIKMTVSNFKSEKPKGANQFNKKSKVIDAPFINAEIDKHLRKITFDKNDSKEKSFLVYFKDQIKLERNVNTKASKTNTLTKLNDYKLHLKVDDILFEDIDYNWVINFRNWLDKSKLQGSTQKIYFVHIRTVLNIAKRNRLYTEDFNYFENLGIKVVYDLDKAMNKEDVNKLFAIKKDEPYWMVAQMFLVSLFGQGLRFSDLILIRNQDFKNGYIDVIMEKTDVPIKAHYNDKLISLLLNYIGLSVDDKLPYYETVSRIMDNVDEIQKKNKNFGLEMLLEYIKTQPPKAFFFKDFRIGADLNNYYKENGKEMTEKEDAAYKVAYHRYNRNLKDMANKHKISVKITTHVARHSFTNLMLEMGVDILIISKALGHSSLVITDSYIKKSFGDSKVIDVSDNLSNLFTT